MNDPTQREFLAEIEELVEQLFAVTEDLRRPETQAPRRRELLARTFRCLHSIKGISSSAGFSAIAELANRTENLLEGARAELIPVDKAFLDLLQDVANSISESLDNLAVGRTEPSPELLIQRLSALVVSPVSNAAFDRLPDLPIDIADSLSERERQLLIEALRTNSKLFTVDADFDLAHFDTEFQKLRETLASFGEIISTLPSAEGRDARRIAFKLYYASKLTSLDLQERLAGISDITLQELSFASANDSRVEQRDTLDDADSLSSLPANFVRLELEELERLRASAHEVFGQIVAALDLVSNSLAGDERTELRNLDAQVRQSLNVLEEQIVELRTISVERVIQRTIRAGQVAARMAGKEVKFSVAGSDLRIDKIVCDAIATSLIHLVRNAVDHGVETPVERTAAGKMPSGAVRIEASAIAGEARFVVADDGRGIDPQVISAVAANRGLIEKDEKLSLDQCLQMIFRAGFTTAATVSNLSGRGVGLDVVEHSVKQIGGSVSARSRPGQGSEFELRLPLIVKVT